MLMNSKKEWVGTCPPDRSNAWKKTSKLTVTSMLRVTKNASLPNRLLPQKSSNTRAEQQKTLSRRQSAGCFHYLFLYYQASNFLSSNIFCLSTLLLSLRSASSLTLYFKYAGLLVRSGNRSFRWRTNDHEDLCFK